MKRLSAGILSAAALAGLAGSTVAYGWGSSGAGSPAPVSSPRSTERPHAQVVRPGSAFRWAPCRPPAHLEHGVCVTDVVRTVVVPAPAAPAVPVAPGTATAQGAATAPSTPAAVAEAGAEPGEDHAEESGEDHEEEHWDDDGDHAEEPDD
ncbi:hypothetical protein GCM10009844_23440 [Nocardioides koreensis]|uniref:Uncharacterized protein n=1 Tax=Nocardioides koreensis TaxID=433651 RepID=A0ABP5LGH6_9ACTN